MVCRKFLVVSTILFDLGEIVVSKTNASDTTRGGRYLVVDIPEVPGSKQDDDLGGYRDNNRAMRYEDDRDRPSDNYNNFRDFHYSEYDDTRTESHENSRMGPCESLIGKLRTELSQNDATITLHGRGNIHNRVPMSYKVSGFNSFHVRRCDPIARGVLSLSLSFNELTFTASDQDPGLWRHSDYDQRRGDMVQVYGLGLEYGFVSDSHRETHMRSTLPRPGVTLNTQGTLFRMNGNGRPTQFIGQDLLDEYKHPLEEYIDNIFHHVVEELRQGSRDTYRF